MPDITKCTNEKCTKRLTCYRWTAPANDYQYYARYEDKDCGYYIEELQTLNTSAASEGDL